MPVTGRELGVELSELWLCANVHLPAAAAEYVSLAGSATDTAGGDSAFGRPGTPPGAPSDVTATMMGNIYPVWSQMRDQFQALMVRSAENLYDTCDALMRVKDAYTDTDADNAEEIGAADASEAFDDFVNGDGTPERPGYREDYEDELVEKDDRPEIPEERTELDEEHYE